ncbi:MAG TPA: hypothetical protein PKZ22_02160 [Accumulibacter sp.]|nr:hypothetical protein [Accumulibacter sp.]
MGARSRVDRRQRELGPPPGHAERRCGQDRRRLHVTDETLAEVAAQLASRAGQDGIEGDGSGWDKLIIPVK